MNCQIEIIVHPRIPDYDILIECSRYRQQVIDILKNYNIVYSTIGKTFVVAIGTKERIKILLAGIDEVDIWSSDQLT